MLSVETIDLNGSGVLLLPYRYSKRQLHANLSLFRI
jgi:hypothetical protein